MRPVACIRRCFGLIPLLVLSAALTPLPAAAQVAGDAPLIHWVSNDTDSGSLILHGENFCRRPEVTLGGLNLEVLSVDTRSRAESITVGLSSELPAGVAELRVRCGVREQSNGVSIPAGTDGQGQGADEGLFSSTPGLAGCFSFQVTAAPFQQRVGGKNVYVSSSACSSNNSLRISDLRSEILGFDKGPVARVISRLQSDIAALEGAGGSQGEKGDQGAQGVPGPPGADGVSGWVRVSQACGFSVGSTTTCTAVCPAATNVMSGGWSTDSENVVMSGNSPYTFNYPNTTSSWSVRLRNEGTPGTLTTWAICAAVE